MMKKKKTGNLPNFKLGTKDTLIAMAGTRCMLCKKDFGHRITWHHMKPRCAKGDNSLSNASLLCNACQQHIHQFSWGSAEYSRLTAIIQQNKQQFIEQKLEKEGI